MISFHAIIHTYKKISKRLFKKAVTSLSSTILEYPLVLIAM